MTDDEKMITLETMLDSDDSADVLSTYLKIAGRKIIAKAYPYDSSVTEIPEKYDLLQCEIAAYLLNKRGAEGQTSHSENGITRNYGGADVPEAMLSSIVPRVGVMK